MAPIFQKSDDEIVSGILANGASRADDTDLAEDNRITTIISTIPSEIQILIFKKLDRVSSTCLGLTSRHFQNIHKTLRGQGRIDLTSYCPLPPDRHDGKFLYQLFKTWMGKDRIFSKRKQRFSRKVKVIGINLGPTWLRDLGDISMERQYLKYKR